MTGQLFEEWILDLDKQFSRQKRKILLIVDNCSAHSSGLSSRLQTINLQFLPPNCTSHVQPFDMGIIQNFKVHYRKRLLTSLISAIERHEPATIHFNMLQCLRWARATWENDVTQSTIANCFRKAGFCLKDTAKEYEDAPSPTSDEAFEDIFERLRNLNFLDRESTPEAYLSVDDAIETTPILTIAEIAQHVSQDENVETSDEETVNEIPAPQNVSLHEANQALLTLQSFFECCTLPGTADTEEIVKSLGLIESKIVKVSSAALKQKKIIDFFHPC